MKKCIETLIKDTLLSVRPLKSNGELFGWVSMTVLSCFACSFMNSLNELAITLLLFFFEHLSVCMHVASFTLQHTVSEGGELSQTAWSQSHQSPPCVLFWAAPTSMPCMKVNIWPPLPASPSSPGQDSHIFQRPAWDDWTPRGLLGREHITVLADRLKIIRNWRARTAKLVKVQAHANALTENPSNTDAYKYVEDVSWVRLK